MALRLSGLLKVMIPTPSVMLLRFLPTARDVWLVAGVSSMDEPWEAREDGCGNEALLGRRCNGPIECCWTFGLTPSLRALAKQSSKRSGSLRRYRSSR